MKLEDVPKVADWVSEYTSLQTHLKALQTRPYNSHRSGEESPDVTLKYAEFVQYDGVKQRDFNLPRSFAERAVTDRLTWLKSQILDKGVDVP